MSRKFKTLGARLLVKDIITTLSLEERAKKAGIEIVIEEDNRPRNTSGRVVGIGSDPLLNEEIHVGDIVHFAPYSGKSVFVEGEEFRSLEHQEVEHVECDHATAADVQPVGQLTVGSAAVGSGQPPSAPERQPEQQLGPLCLDAE